jgi:hypothetical protein
LQAAPARRPYTDDARRVADEMSLHAVARARGWAVFRLRDGRPADHVAYPRREDAVRAMGWNRDDYLYLEIRPDGMPDPAEAQAVLGFARALHKAGFRLPSPDFDFTPVMPAFAHDRVRTIRHLATGGKVN